MKLTEEVSNKTSPIKTLEKENKSYIETVADLERKLTEMRNKLAKKGC